MNKNMNCPVLLTEASLLILKGGKRLFMHSSHPCFNRAVDAVKRGAFNNIERLFQLKETVEKCFDVTVKNGSEVYYKGKKVNNVLTEKILGCIRNGLPYKPWIKFLNNLMQNPEEYCREQLFSHVEKYGLPIDSNGFVYSWKAVNSKLKDKFSGKVSYAPGQSPKLKREDCEQDPTVACGAGLHSGATDYVLNYGSNTDDRFVLVKFNPKDVISCPGDSSWQKLRACRLTVVREVKREDVKPLGDKYMGSTKQPRKLNGQFAKKSELVNA